MIKGEHRTSTEYGKINPQRTVPTLIDNGKTITDSHAIITYLVEAYGKGKVMSIYPADHYMRAKVNSRLHYDSGTITPKTFAIGAPIMYKGATEYDADAITAFYTVLDTLEMFLSEGNYLAGNEMTVADFSVIPSVSTMMASEFIDFGKYSKIRAWVDRMSKLPYYEEVNGKWIGGMHEFFKAKLVANKAAK